MHDVPAARPIGRQAILDVAPMLIAIVPFGLVVGATAVANGHGISGAAGLSVIVFAGASQLAVLDVLATGGSWLVAVFTAWTINLRLVLYSASIAPRLAGVPLPWRLLSAYVLVDQNYALSITTFDRRSLAWRDRLRYFGTGGLVLWVNWQLCTLVGAVVGSRVPDDIPLTFAAPLVFLVLLIPTLKNRAAVAAALAGGTGALVAAEVGWARTAILCGAVCGIVAGSVVAFRNPPAEETS